MSASPDPTLAAALDRARKSYDDIPYDHAPMMRSHPGRLAAQSVWRGLAAPDAGTARILEIGCASAGNLLPLAATLPEARLLGVDLSPVQIAAGEARRVRYGLTNIELRAASFEALGEVDGAFDFIICHGVYSWIPEPLRDALLRTIHERLAPEGLAMVSFNVLPGWRLFQIARDAMLLHARMTDDPARRAATTRELFRALAEQSPDTRTYGKFWRAEARHLASGGDAYIAHELFEESNAPVAFADFAAHAARHGLDYLGEAVVVANSEADLAPDGASTIRRLSGGDRLKRESYIDIFSGRTFREALLVRAGRADALAPTPPESALRTLNFLPALDLRITDDGPGGFCLAAGETEIAVDSLAGKPALLRLVERGPASSRLADLVLDGPSETALGVAEILRVAVEAGLVAISSQPVECASRLAERPKIWPLAAMDTETSDNTVTRRHSAFQFTSLQRYLATLVDGTRTRDDLVEAAVALAQSGGITVGGPDGLVTDPSQLRERLAVGVDKALAGLLRNGLLV